MSQLVKHDIVCPKCKEISQQSIFHSVNTIIDNVAIKLFNDEINFVTCNDCGNKFQVKTSLLFNNMEKHYALYYNPISFENIDLECIGMKNMLGENHYLTNPTKFKDWELFKKEIKRRENF